MSDADSDEDLQKAIALSLVSSEPGPREINAIFIEDDDDEDDDDLDKPRNMHLLTSARTRANRTPSGPSESTQRTVIDLSTPMQLLSETENEAAPPAVGLLGLDRRQMEEERLARVALGKKAEVDISISKKRKASTSPIHSRDRARREKERLRNLSEPIPTPTAKRELGESTCAAPALADRRKLDPLHLENKGLDINHPQVQEPINSPPHNDTTVSISSTKAPHHLHGKEQSRAVDVSGIQYLDGIVKKTWAFGYDRRGDDIKIEEVLQKNDLQLAVLSSYQIDADWITSKLDSKTKVVWVVQAKDEAQKQNWAAEAPRHFRFCFPAMDGNVNCMHSKLQLLAHPTHLRVVIPSANLTPHDWGETGCLENVCFLIDLPRLPDGQEAELKRLTRFGEELLAFLHAMGLDKAQIDSMRRFDFSRTAHLAFVHSIGGSHLASTKMPTTGLCGLGKAVRDLGLDTEGPLNIDFLAASIGNLNEKFLKSMYLAAKGDDGMTEYEWRNHRSTKKKGVESEEEHRVSDEVRSRCRIYFPSYETVHTSRGGIGGAGTICFQPKYWASDSFPRGLMRDCKSQREGLLMHSKMIFVRPDNPNLHGNMAWAYLGSHNLSESAWGRLVKDNTTKKPKINIRNWECGVVIPVASSMLPVDWQADHEALADGPGMSVFDGILPVPMIVPGEEYQGRRPWFYSEQ